MKRSRPGTLLIALPTEVVHVVTRNEFMNCLKAKSLHAIMYVQSMSNGVFWVTCKTQDAYSWLCTNGIAIRGFQCTIMEVQPSYTLVRLFRCPFEVPDKAIILTLAPFGKVMDIKHETDRDFPSVVTGTRFIRMKLTSDIPSRIKVKRYPCNVWYNGPPKKCRIWGEEDHEAPTCPYKGKCLDTFRKATLPETASTPGVFRRMVLWGILLLPLLSLRMSLNFKNLLVSMYLYQMAASLSHPPAPLSRHLPPRICLQLKKLRWRLQSTHPFSSHPKPPDTSDPSASMFSDSSPESTKPSKGASSPQPLVDKDGFVVV